MEVTVSNRIWISGLVECIYSTKLRLYEEDMNLPIDRLLLYRILQGGRNVLFGSVQ